MTRFFTMINLIAIAIGGAMGALSRYGLSACLTRVVLQTSYWAIMTVNLIGCLLIGLVGVLLISWRSHESWTLFLITGFIGSFTTYSTFAFNSVALLERQQLITALIYVSGHLFGGILFCFLGIYLGKLWLN